MRICARDGVAIYFPLQSVSPLYAGLDFSKKTGRDAFGKRDRLRPTPLPLRLYYLVTPIVAIDNAHPAVSPEREHALLGRVMQLFYEHPIMRGADLRDTLAGMTAEIAIRLYGILATRELERLEYLPALHALSVHPDETVASEATDAVRHLLGLASETSGQWLRAEHPCKRRVERVSGGSSKDRCAAACARCRSR